MKKSSSKLITTKNILIQNVNILDVANAKEYKGEVLITSGKIVKIIDYKNSPAHKVINNDKSYQIINADGAYLSCGFIDAGVHLESASDKSLDSISAMAITSGVTAMTLAPQINCALDNPAVIRSISKYVSSNKLVQIFALGAISQNYKSEQMSEIGTLLESGAIGITADPIPENLQLLVQFVRYASSFNSQFDFRLWANPQEQSFSKSGLVNNGMHSAKYGLSTIPSFSETVVIAKFIELLEYQKQLSEKYLQSVHFQSISSARSAKLVAGNSKLSAGIPIANLLYNDSQLDGFNADFRTNPPIRSSADQKVLRSAIKNDDKFVIYSNHYDFHEEQIKVPFGEVKARGGRYGVINNLLSGVVLLAQQEKIPLLKILSSITTTPAKLIGKAELCEIKLNQNANFCLFEIGKNSNVKIKATVVNGKTYLVN